MDDFVRHGDTVLIEACLLAGDCEFVTCTVGRQSVKVNPEQVHPYKPRPKHDPCRKFKKGDKVRVVEWNGRDIARIGQIGRVVSDEHNSRVELAIDGWTSSVYYPACHLELVTPVEELEPYSVVRPENYQCVRIMKEKRIHSSIPFDEEECVYRTLEEAKAAAEAECKRLNDEWRKEQNNG